MTTPFRARYTLSSIGLLALVLGVAWLGPFREGHAQPSEPDIAASGEVADAVADPGPVTPPAPTDRWRLSEEELVALAAEQSHTVAAARIALEEATTIEEGSHTFRPWVLEARAEYTHNSQSVRDTLSSGVQTRDSFVWLVGVAKAWDIGLELAVRLTNTITRSETPLMFEFEGMQLEDIRVIGPYNLSILSATITQHLLKGRNSEVNDIPEALAESRVDAATLALEQDLSNALLTVLEGYWDLRQADRQAELRRGSVARIDAQRQITVELVDAGTLARIELDVVDQQRLTAEEAVLLADLARERDELELRRLAGIGNTDPRTIAPTTPETVPPTPLLSEDELVRLAEEHAFAVRAVDQQIESQYLEVLRTEEELEPTLDVIATLSRQGLDDALGSEDAFFFDAYKQIALLDYGGISLGVLFSMPLGYQRIEAEYDAAEITLRRLEIEREAAKAAVGTQVRSVVRAMESSRKRLGLLQRSVELASRNLEAGRERFRAGRLTTLDVMRLQEELDAAQSQLLAARIEIVKQGLRLDHLCGSLLERFHATASPRP